MEETKNSTSSTSVQSPESEGDPESGFSNNWANSNAQRTERRSREVRHGSGDARPRRQQQQQQQQTHQENETVTEEEESKRFKEK